jgi:hypothetical protein
LPALHATRIDPVRALRGELTANARPSRARNVLIVAQVVVSALLLIGAGIFLRSATRSGTADPGVRLSDTIVIEFDDRERQTLTSTVVAAPAVSAVAASWPGTPFLSQARAAFGSAGSTSPQSPLEYRLVSARYFSVLGIDITKGRGFTEDEARASAALTVVSESVARQFWPNADAIGQTLRLDPAADSFRRDDPRLPARRFTVIGVSRDVPGYRIGMSEANVYVPFDLYSTKASLIARVEGDPEPVRRTLLDRLTAIDPNLHQVITMRTLGMLQTYPLQVAFWITVVLGGLALALTLSGIYSVLSYLVVQRANEIGVRIALGATTTDVTRLVLWQSLRLVVMGLTIGIGLAWAASTAFMATPIAARLAGFIDVRDGIAYVGALSFVVGASLVAAAVPTLRAARIDPVTTLRQE